MARAHSAATTDESTPPERPKMTRSSPTSARMASMESSMMESIVQSGSSSHTPNRKFRSMVWPNSVWRTSGWNCVANRRRSGNHRLATNY